MSLKEHSVKPSKTTTKRTVRRTNVKRTTGRVVREIGVRKSKLLLKQSESSNHLQALPRAIVKRAATAKSRTTKGGEFRSDMLLANEIIVEALKLI